MTRGKDVQYVPDIQTKFYMMFEAEEGSIY